MSEIKKYRYLFAVLLTVLIFTLGILASNLADDKRQSDLKDTLSEDADDIKSKQMLMRYLEDKESCELRQDGLVQIVEGYNDRLDRVQTYEESSFFQESEFRSVRRSYMLSGVEYWMFAEELEEDCQDYNANTILFFTEEDCESCDRQGDILSDIKRVQGENVLVFSIYTDLDDSMVNLLKEEYSIEQPPAVVINQNTTLSDVQPRQNITEHLDIEE